MPTFLEIKSLLRQKIAEGLETVVANAAINYFESRITEQKDIKGNAFQKRTYDLQNRKGRAVLIQKGDLRRSIQIKEKTDTSLTLTADTTLVGSAFDYAEIHNEGGEIVVTEKMKAFFWAKYYETEGRQSTNKRGERRNTKQNKQLSQDALFWRNLALKKVGDKITIPQRRFIGENEELKTLLYSKVIGFFFISQKKYNFAV
jgi:phage gpG-like protein